MSLDQYLKVIWKWLWLILLAAVVAAVASYFATRMAPRVYQTKTTIMIGRFINDPNPDSGDFWISQQLGQTYAQLATREPVLYGAIEALNLTDQISWASLAANVNVSLVAGTQLMEISVSDTNPQRAKALADAIAQQLILQSPSNPSADQEDYRAFSQQQLADLETKIEASETEIEALQAELDEAISARRIQELDGQINALQGKVSTWQSSYAQFLTFLQGGEVNYLTVVEPASVPTIPIAPRVELNILTAMVIAVTLAVGAAFLLEYMDDTIRTEQDLERFDSAVPLGSILHIDNLESGSLPISIRSPRTPVVEAYRALRTNVRLASVEEPIKTLVVTSAGPSEGKSTIAANLAVVMAQAGLSIVLIDGDLRRPVLHRMFDLPNIGLANDLLDEKFARGLRSDNPGANDLLLQPTVVENLSVMTSGAIPPNPAELLSSLRMKRLLRETAAEVDFVIIDSPPVLVVTDAVVLASSADGVLLVVRCGQTRRPMLRRAIEVLERTGTPILGSVLNSLSPRSDSYHYYYRQLPLDGRGKRTGRQPAGRSWRIAFPRLFARQRHDGVGDGGEPAAEKIEKDSGLP